MSSDTSRHHIHVSDIRLAFNRIWWSLINWNPDAFELFTSLIWVIWGLWTIVTPSIADNSRYSVLFTYVSTSTLGSALAAIGSMRLCVILLSSFGGRKALGFLSAVIWGVIAVMLVVSNLNISSVSHAIFAAASGWSYLRLRE